MNPAQNVQIRPIPNPYAGMKAEITVSAFIRQLADLARAQGLRSLDGKPLLAAN